MQPAPILYTYIDRSNMGQEQEKSCLNCKRADLCHIMQTNKVAKSAIIKNIIASNVMRYISQEDLDTMDSKFDWINEILGNRCKQYKG